jgi:hypothetical protein
MSAAYITTIAYSGLAVTQIYASLHLFFRTSVHRQLVSTLPAYLRHIYDSCLGFTASISANIYAASLQYAMFTVDSDRGAWAWLEKMMQEGRCSHWLTRLKLEIYSENKYGVGKHIRVAHVSESTTCMQPSCLHYRRRNRDYNCYFPLNCSHHGCSASGMQAAYDRVTIACSLQAGFVHPNVNEA